MTQRIKVTSATCARARSSPPASRRRRRTSRGRAAIPNGRPASTSRAARCAAATPTRPTSTRRGRPSASARRAAPTTTATSTTTCTHRRCSIPGRADPGAPAGAPGRCALPGVGRATARADVVRPRLGDGDRRQRDARAGARALQPAAHVRALPAARATAPADPDDYVQRGRGLPRRDGFTYTEAPPAKARTLDGFLFDAKPGYCQQFSGAMALLLRMGGIPARVATGFSTGATDRKTGEYVVRDFDAHSWVEAYFPSYGWVTFDPTPPPRRRARRAADRARRGATGDAPDLGGGGALDPRAGTRGAATAHAVVALRSAARRCSAALAARRAGAFAFAGAAAAAPARCPSSSARCGARAATPAPGTTLHALERRFAARPPPRATCARCASSATAAAATPPTPRPAPRPAVRARARRRPARAAARMVGAAAASVSRTRLVQSMPHG